MTVFLIGTGVDIDVGLDDHVVLVSDVDIEIFIVVGIGADLDIDVEMCIDIRVGHGVDDICVDVGSLLISVSVMILLFM